MTIDTQKLNQMLAELRGVASVAGGKNTGSPTEVQGPGFADVLKNTIDQVNAAQKDAQKLAEDFAAGQENVNLQDVMINLQKANISFQQMVQVRNKLVTAYNDIMNMQV